MSQIQFKWMVKGSSADGDDSAASSMESNDTYGSVAALFSYEARKQGMATVRYAPGKYASLWLPRTVEAAYGQQEGGSADGSECRHGPAHGVRVTSLLSHYGAAASEVLSGCVRDAPPDRNDGRLGVKLEG
jgi:hypothetical protein